MARCSGECGETNTRIEQPREKLRCPQCESGDVTRKGENPRTFVSVPIGGRPTEIVLDVPRVQSAACRITRQVEVCFADPHEQHTRQLARYALELTRLMTIQDVALHLEVGWDLVKEIMKKDLQQQYFRPALRELNQFAIDEI